MILAINQGWLHVSFLDSTPPDCDGFEEVSWGRVWYEIEGDYLMCYMDGPTEFMEDLCREKGGVPAALPSSPDPMISVQPGSTCTIRLRR